jgi:hypothetical protein
MKAHYLTLILAFVLTGCSKELTTKDVDKLTLYWDSRNYPDRKELVFEFYSELCENHYNLYFNHSVGQNEILIELTDVEFDKECGDPNHPEYDCYSTGGFTIPEALISEGDYSFIVRTGSFEVISQFIVQDTVFILNIPENEHFSSSISVEPSVW